MVSGLVVLEVVRVICSEGGGRRGGGGEVQRGGTGATEEEGGGGGRVVKVRVSGGGPGHGGVLQDDKVETKVMIGKRGENREETR